MTRKTYTECIAFDTFEERYNYLRIGGSVAHETFAAHRYLNQAFYTSRAWKDVRNRVIIRDAGCDLAVPGYELFDSILVHHINPISENDLITRDKSVLDMDNLITVSMETHNAIHYGNLDESRFIPEERRPGDTILW